MHFKSLAGGRPGDTLISRISISVISILRVFLREMMVETESEAGLKSIRVGVRTAAHSLCRKTQRSKNILSQVGIEPTSQPLVIRNRAQTAELSRLTIDTYFLIDVFSFRVNEQPF